MTGRTSTRRTAAATTAALAMAAALITGAAAAPAGAATAAVACSSLTILSDPGVVPSPQTAKTATGSTGTAQVRYGTYNGKQYGWARTTDYNYNDLYIKFEVDTNGDRDSDCSYYRAVTSRTYTTAKATHSSSDVAFRACLLFNNSFDCDAATTKTGWW
jgi:hypothetical protein